MAAPPFDGALLLLVGEEARGCVLWLTRLSGAGKSTIAEAEVAQLREAGHRPIHLDGGGLRASLCADLGFSPEDVRWTPEAARRILGRFEREAFVRYEIDERIRRDPKGCTPVPCVARSRISPGSMRPTNVRS